MGFAIGKECFPDEEAPVVVTAPVGGPIGHDISKTTHKERKITSDSRGGIAGAAVPGFAPGPLNHGAGIALPLAPGLGPPIGPLGFAVGMLVPKFG